MAPDVIDLISSSPPDYSIPPPSAQLPVDIALPPAKEQHQDTNATKSTAVAQLPISSSLFLSDDFDTTIDLDEPILIDENPSKRRCLSPPQAQQPPLKRTSPVTESRSILPPVRTNTNGRLQPLDDSIQLTSSPGFLSPSQMGPANDARTKSTEQTIEAEDSDPFASSPTPVRCSPPKPVVKPISRTVARPIESSDPFASSPHQSAPTTSKEPDIIITSPPERGPAPKPLPKKNATWDPISSSAPEIFSFDSSPPGKKRDVINIDDDSNGENGSEDDLPDIASFDINKMRRRSQLQRSQSDVIGSRTRAKPTASNKQSAADKTREKEAKAAAKELEKEAKKREKQEAKEAKLCEKQRNAALAEVNKLRTDKKISTPEMMVDIPSSLNSTVTTALQTMLEPFDVQYTTWDSPVENVIKWRRKVRSRYNDDLGLWEPIPLRLQDEKHALVVMHSDEFVKIALDDGVSPHAEKMKKHFPEHHVVYLIEGLTPWMRKNRNLRNRQFTSTVRAQEATTAANRRNKPAHEYVPEEKIEDALLQLQVMHEVLIHHTMIPMETAEQILTFTQHISTIPYRKQRDQATLGAGFCMESGQVKTGEDTHDTYVRMLQEIVRVTAPIAYGVANEFNTVSKLVEGLETRGPTRLEGVKKMANKDGAYSDRTVGQAVSRRMYKVFTGVDETSTDV